MIIGQRYKDFGCQRADYGFIERTNRFSMPKKEHHFPCKRNFQISISAHLQDSFIGEAVIPFIGNDQVIDNVNIKHLTCIGEFAGKINILLTRFEIS